MSNGYAARPEGAVREYVGGMPVDLVDEDEVVRIMASAIVFRHRCRVVPINVDGVVLAHRDYRFARILFAATLVVPDGMPIVWVLRRRGRVVRRVTGVDLLERVLREIPARVVLIGGEPGIANSVANLTSSQGWNSHVVGSFAPSRAEVVSNHLSSILVRSVRALRPDAVFVGFGSPLQEHWLNRFGDELGAPLLMGVGASFDFLAGSIPRAPRTWQDNGFEWLYRMRQEPVRLGARYIARDWRFFPLVWKYRQRPIPMAADEAAPLLDEPWPIRGDEDQFLS